MHPAGIIDLWFGAIVDIPAGWALCDGNNGTPDLRGLFVVCAGGALNPGDTGGSVDHNHTFTGDGHSHTLLGGVFIGTGAARSNLSSTNPAVGTTDNKDALPPFYALAYIMHL